MNIIKRTLRTAFVCFVILASVILRATEVNENEILAAARKWIADNAMFQTELPNAVPEKAIQMTYFDGKAMPLWRVDLKPTGYLIMSADDTLPPVVAFDTKAPYDIPAGHPLPSMLNRQGKIFQDELDKPLTRGNEQAAENKSRWNALLGRTRADSITPSTIVQSPMIATTWNQNAPYYYFCPSGSVYAEHALTGCVAVATAQLMKYYEWPPVGVGTKEYTDNIGSITGSMKADFSIPYEWNAMMDSYAEKEERNYGVSEFSIARLAMEIGVLVEANYEVDLTAALAQNLHTLMAQYLGYSNSANYGDTRYGMFGYIAQSTLYSRIRTDMTAGRPAFVAFEGHIFIADGLGTMGGQDYYHFNYGWGGQFDGWYLLTDGEENTVIVAATTNIQPSPVPVFKPMSVEQPSSFTLAWDFPKHVTAEAFRLTKTTGTRASEVIDSSISGTARSYNLTDQSGTATYKLEAKVGGNWKAISNGITVKVKADPADMLELTVSNELKSIAGKQVTTTINANNTLTGVTVTSSRPDILPDSGITVTVSGTTSTVKLSPISGTKGNLVLYITATDAVGNTVRQFVPMAVMEDEPLTWYTSKTEAFDLAAADGKMVLMVAGRDTCANTNYFRNTVCETADIKAILLADYVLWYTIVDDPTSDFYMYTQGMDGYLPFVAIIDPEKDKRLKGHSGPMSIPDARNFFNPCTPIFSLFNYEPFVAGSTQTLELFTLKEGVDIRYRFDSSEPTISDTLYTEPITLTSTTTISARAFENGEPVSPTETMTYTFLEQVATPVINTPLYGYCFLPYKVTATCETPGATIRYRLDNYIPSYDSPVLPDDGVSITAFTPFVVVAFKDGMKESNYAYTYLDVVNDIDGASAVVTGDVQVGSPSTSASWFVQNNTYNSAPSAFQSAAISPGKSSIMAAKVSGPGKLTFQWRASTDKKYYDCLEFSIDGTSLANNYGVDSWAQKEFTVTGEGDHILLWEYYKYASYTGSGGYAWVDDIIWTPIDADTLISIVIDGASNIASGSTESYICTATWGDDSTTTVSPTWSLSSTTYAIVDDDGKVTNKNTTTTDQTVTLNATYTHNGVIQTTSKNLTLAKRTLVSINVDGPDAIDSGSSATYTCIATWSDGTTTDVKPTWDISSWNYANITNNGKVTNQNTTETDQTVVLTAAYTFNGVNKTATKGITLKKRVLQSIAINGGEAIHAGDIVTYSCTATWSDGATTVVTLEWTLSADEYASIDTNGKVTNKNTTDNDQTVNLTATYTHDGVTKTVSKTITLLKRVLTYLAINGDATISSGSTATYTATATWSDDATTTVTPTWSLSNTAIASVDATGKVVNKNTTNDDQSVTLTANFTAGDVTKTATKVIILSKRLLTEIVIDGDVTIPTGGTANYGCTATWSYGDSTTVTPTWSITPTTYASVNTTGDVTNKNTTDEDQTVTLTASCTVGDVTKTATKVITLAKRTLTDIVIDGDATIATGGTASYTCNATWSYGDFTAVIPTWTLSTTTYASIDVDGKVVNKNTTDEDQTVTLTATCKVGDVTKTATKDIKLSKRTLQDIVIEGDAMIASGGFANYTCTAIWSYGNPATVIPTWTLSNTIYASVDADGKVLNKNMTDENQTVTLTANFTVGDITQTASKNITLTKRTLESITIDGATRIASGEASTYSCTVTWSDGTTSIVTPEWSILDSPYASVDEDGKVSNKNTTGEDKSVLLVASYTFGDVTKKAQMDIILSKRMLTELSIVGDDIIPSGGSATYVGIATWSDGEQSDVTPTWSLSSTTYAIVDADGKVTNKNTTVEDQTLTLTAEYTFGDVTKTVSKTIVLTNRSLVSISIAGDDVIPSGGLATYVCTATWSDDTTSTATAVWSLSATDHAAVSVDGKVTNKNIQNNDQTVTLTASYEAGNVTKTATKVITLEKRSLENIVIDGDATIDSNGVANYTCTATWSYGDSTAITPTWSITPTTYASVNASGTMTNMNATDEDKTVTLTATFTIGDVTKTATKVIALAKRTLTEIVIDGDATIASGGTASYTCTATWSYGDSTTVTPTWSITPTTYASVNTAGIVTNMNATDDDQAVTLTATFTVSDVTKTATKVVTLAKRTLTEIVIDGDATITSGGTATYTCTAIWSYGDSVAITPAWSLSITNFASIDADGMVVNKNTTDEDQSVTLTASYTIGDITKTATKVIKLSKRTLMEIVIDGDAVISTGETATYTCTATWSYGDPTTVTPTWSITPTTYASVNTAGAVTNMNATDEDQAVTLTANFTVGDVTKTASKVITLSKRTLENIAIDGDALIPTGRTASYTCSATWSYGDPTSITPTWTLSATTYASVDADGNVMNKNTTDEDQAVTLTASYTVGDVTKTASKVITPEKRTLTEIVIDGDSVISTGGTITYDCTAIWSYGESTDITPTWSLSSTDYASVGTDGKVTNMNATDEDQSVTLTASFTVGDLTKTASKVITLEKRTLTDIAIEGDSVISTGGTASYTCKASWSYGDSTVVTPTWSLSSINNASIDADGNVTNKNATDDDQTVTLTANYTIGNVTKTATKEIVLAKRTLTDIVIDGDATIVTDGVASYTCMASWSYGDSTTVTPMWSVTPTTYASVSTTGNVTNMNATDEDQTVTLTANYTVGTVSKTATKVITLSKRTLMEIIIDGDTIIPTVEVANYTCTAIWSYGVPTVITPVWSLSSTNYSSIDADGNVTNKNTTDDDQAVTLNASYTVGDVTKTETKEIVLAKRTLTDITIDGDSVISTGGDANYTCTATWSIGDHAAVTPIWSLSSTNDATVDADGKVTNKNATDEDQTVTLTATYTSNDITKTATKVITLSKRTLIDIAIDGDAIIPTGGAASYICTATWSYGDFTAITPTWSLSSTNYASIDADGKVTNKNTTDDDQTVTLTANYTVGDVTKTAAKEITLSKRTLTNIAIVGETMIASGATATYTCTATWSYGESTVVIPVWGLSVTNYASIDANGNVSNKNVTDEDESVTLTANYTVGDVTTTATKEILLEKRTLVELTIVGDEIIPSGSAATYICTVTWSDGKQSNITPNWSLSDTIYAMVDADGKVTNCNTTADDQTVTLNASYTFGDVTKTASKNITLTNRSLVSITIDGDEEISSGGMATYVCTATWSDGATSTAMAMWSLEPAAYASVDASGKVTNRNTTADDQTVTLTASYEAGNVTKTATIVITLAKRTLTDIVIDGDSVIATGGISIYVCTAIWSYGDSTAVTPTWSLSSTDYAAVEVDGKVTNKNTTDEDKTVTLTATYTSDNVTKTASKVITLAKRTLTEIAIDGDTTIATGGTANYTCTASWSYGDSTVVTPIWSLSSTTFASIDTKGELSNKNSTNDDQIVTLTASVTVGDMTRTATKDITLSKRTLMDITIAGDTAIDSGKFAIYSCTATWSYGDSTVVTPMWSLSSSDYASVDADGKVLNKNATDEDQSVTLTVNYTVGEVSKTSTKVITLTKRALEAIAIEGNSTIASGEAATYVCTATCSYGDPTVVVPTWSLSDTTYASIDADGKITNKNATDEDQLVTLNASYTVADVTKTVTKDVILSKRILTDIAIDGDIIISTGGAASYVCTAIWSYGDSTIVVPTWSLSSTAYASIDADGKVTNLNTTDEDQTVTLNASYEAGNIAKVNSMFITLSKRSLESISIEWESIIPTGGVANYSCTATWSCGDSTVVTPTWNLSDATYASIDATGNVTNKNSTDEDQLVTLTATYTSDDVTKTATKVITLSKRILTAITIEGDTTIASGGVATYLCSAIWSYGESTSITPEWSLSSDAFATVDTTGNVTNKNTTGEEQTVMLTASYTVGDVTKTAAKEIMLAKRTLAELFVAGDEIIPSGSFATYTCTATWSDGEQSNVTPTWSLSSTTYAIVDTDGKVTNQNSTDEDQTLTLTASYTFGDVTKTASKTITLTNRSLVSISIAGDDEIPNGSVATYVCTATWSDGATSTATAAWSLSSTEYASVDASGKVTNSNTTATEQTVTLTANYEAGDVKKTATKEISLAKRSLTDVVVEGDGIIPSGGIATYICTAIWSYGDSMTVTPKWSLSSTDYATIDDDGKVTSKNTTDEEKTVTLTASYTYDNVTKTVTKIITLSKRTLNEIAIAGDTTIPTASTATYTCTAIWSYGDSTVATPTWSLSSTTYASIEEDGKVVNKNTTDVDQTVTLTASYTVGDITKTTIKIITLAKRLLTEIVVNGDETISSGESATYTCTASWSNGDSTAATPTWSLSSTDYASVDADGKVTNQNSTDKNQTVTLTATYTSNDVTKTVAKVITLSKRMLIEVVVNGDETIASGESATYTCTAIWNYGDSTVVTPTWSLSSTDYATVDDNGKVTNMNTTIDEQTVTLTANYTVGDVTKTATKLITLKEIMPLVLELSPGWNLVTLRRSLASDADGVQKFLSLNPIKCDADNQSYVFCGDADSIKPGIGYWIYSRSRQSVKLSQDIEKPVSMLSLKPGWNLIGIVEAPDWPSSDVVIWAWENNRFKLIDMADMRPGCAYWVYYIQ